MESKIKHLEFIQNVIVRMAKNSFLLKGWAITVVGAIVALSLKDKEFLQPMVSIILVTSFWIMDVYYLIHEKRFRRLYDAVRVKKDEEIDFSLHAESHAKCCDWFSAFFSPAQGLFYGSLILVNIIIITSN